MQRGGVAEGRKILTNILWARIVLLEFEPRRLRGKLTEFVYQPNQVIRRTVGRSSHTFNLQQPDSCGQYLRSCRRLLSRGSLQSRALKRSYVLSVVGRIRNEGESAG